MTGDAQIGGCPGPCLDWSMDDFSIGDTVQITTGPMEHSVGTVVYFYEKQGRYLVRVGASMQDYYAPDEIEFFNP